MLTSSTLFQTAFLRLDGHRPTPTILWSRSGRALSPGQDRPRYRWSLGNHTLHISRLTFDDDGRYLCNASNDVGYRVFSIDLRVYSTTIILLVTHAGSEEKMLYSRNLILCRLANCCDANFFALAAKYHIERCSF